MGINMEDLAGALRHNTSIQDLTLYNNEFDYSDMAVFFNMIRDNTSVTSLTLLRNNYHK
jgi:hypothetical protein